MGDTIIAVNTEEVTINDRLCTFGILGMEIFCNDVDLLTRGKGKPGQRDGVGGRDMRVKAVIPSYRNQLQQPIYYCSTPILCIYNFRRRVHEL